MEGILIRFLMAFSLIFSTLVPAGLVSTAYAGDDACDGIVRGISNNYNLRKGTGYLAVRNNPTAKSALIDQLFNNDRVVVLDRQGSWLWVNYNNGGSGAGWVHRKFIRLLC